MNITAVNPAHTGQLFLRDTDLAERYNVTRNSIWRWAKQERMPQPVRLSPGCVRWRLEDIQRWEHERAEVPA